MQEMEQIKANQKLRVKLAKSSLGWFSHLYLGHYIANATPDFHWQIYRDLTNDEISFIEIIGFRGSAKSTLASLALPLWASVTGRKKFIIPISDSFPQAKLIIANIIHELEDNALLKEDFGPFRAKEEWQAVNVVLHNGTRIFARSKGQKIRGLRHQQFRPDLIICDDIENTEEVRTLEQRNKTEEWFLSDVFPAIETGSGKLVVIGSLLHTDSLIARLKKQITEHGTGTYREYPIMVDGRPLWPSRFDLKGIEKLRHQFGTRFFMREHLLKLVPDEGQVIKQVQYYSQLPELIKIGIGVDLAISQKQTADYSAINCLGMSKEGKYYNIKTSAGRWNFNQTLEQINDIYTGMKTAFKGIPVLLGVEDVAYQKSAIEEIIRRYHLPVKPIKVNNDKRSRLQSAEPYFISNQIFFRQNEDADVVNEILNFGIEQYDDRMDAFLHSLFLTLQDARPDILWI